MAQPHHHIFNALQQAIIKKVKIEAVLPHLVQKKVIPESDIKKYEGNFKNGMKILINYLRNRSYETFLDFAECIFLAQKEPSETKIVDSMIKAVQEFDQRNNSTHAQRIADIQQKYTKLVVEETETEVKQPLVVEKEDIPSSLEEAPLIGGKDCMGELFIHSCHCDNYC